ncbi:P-loop containing nucleoside triphosphate hydrolase protein, partial [Irpex rosettiformis]
MVSPFSTQSGPSWACDAYDWCAPEGITRLQDLLRDKVPYELAQRQLIATAKLLNGQHGMYVWATGDGKSSVFYLYSLVRPTTMTIVVSPTNALEDDMVRRLKQLDIPAVAINHDSLNKASSSLPPRDLWAEVRNGAANIILLSPEMLLSKNFKKFIQCDSVRARLALFCVDECHLVDEWGLDFRKAYGQISDTIPWLPTWTTRCGLTATLEPGRQTQAVTRALGFHDGNFFLNRRDCERYNINVVLCPVQHAYTTDEFRDLDWIIPPSMKSAADIPKTLIYCETIDLGHRLTAYL